MFPKQFIKGPCGRRLRSWWWTILPINKLHGISPLIIIVAMANICLMSQQIIALQSQVNDPNIQGDNRWSGTPVMGFRPDKSCSILSKPSGHGVALIVVPTVVLILTLVTSWFVRKYVFKTPIGYTEFDTLKLICKELRHAFSLQLSNQFTGLDTHLSRTRRLIKYGRHFRIGSKKQQLSHLALPHEGRKVGYQERRRVCWLDAAGPLCRIRRRSSASLRLYSESRDLSLSIGARADNVVIW